MPKMIADRRLYLTADRERVVEEGDPDAAFLLVAAGCELDEENARRYGLLDRRRAKETEDGGEKALEGPPADKAVRRSSNKSRGRRRAEAELAGDAEGVGEGAAEARSDQDPGQPEESEAPIDEEESQVSEEPSEREV